MPKEYRVTFLPLDRVMQAEEGQNILEIAMRAGVHINASCSGNGVCGKCKVKVMKGTAVSPISPRISQTEYDEGIRLACQSIINSDVAVEVPLESQIDKSSLKKTAGDTHISSDYQIDELFKSICVDPLVSRLCVKLPEPTLEDNVADFDRLVRGLGNRLPEMNTTVSLNVMREFGKIARESGWKVAVTLMRSGESFEIIRIEPGGRTDAIYAIAIDIGTTTVCARLIDVSESRSMLTAHSKEQRQEKPGRLIAEAADYNSQISYGEDVISRIMYARKKGGLKKLQGLVIKTVNSIINELLTESATKNDQISMMVFAGNTVMMHLLFAIDPTHIMLAPYIPATTSFPSARARHLGIEIGEHVHAFALPCVASYIGGDIVAGVIASSMRQNEGVSLYMDIGTNGEIVLGNKEWLLSASCSAGPAFEGGGIQFGMRASRGAIERVRINPTSFEPMIFTVAKTTPAGICGSGLIDIVAGLLETGLIDQKGKFKKDTGTKRIRKGPDGYEYVLCFAPETGIDKDIVITEIDLDNLIRTKAAIYAGCKVLLDSAGLSFPDLDTIIIAGGFGHYIDVGKAKVVGLLPDLSDNKFRFIGNGSLSGAHLVALNSDIWLEAKKIAKMMTNVELSNSNRFMQEFVAAMFLPHTDQGLFPQVMERLRGL
jgi:uncharacterized 2Fe-2S/4Fe-4S cluster protein (DUF4445 family)